MMSDKLSTALLQAMEIELSLFPSDTELNNQYSFTAQFEKKMRKLIGKTNRKYIQIFGHRVRRAAAVAVLVIALSSGVMSVEAARVKIFEIITTVYEEFTSIVFQSSQNTDSDVLVPIEPTYIPNGFTVYEHHRTEDDMILIYTNSDNTEVCYLQKVLELGETIIDTEGATQKVVKIGAQEVNIVQKNSHTTLYWMDDYNYYTIISTVNGDELLKMAESVIKQNN